MRGFKDNLEPPPGNPNRKPSTGSLRALDLLNVFKADAQNAVGPYLAIHLLASQHWDLTRIGIAMSVPGIVTILAQIPAGALVDSIRRKRALLATAAVALAAGCLAIAGSSNLIAVAAAQMLIAIASILMPAAIAALSLGLVGHCAFARQMGRNEACSHCGAIAAAVGAGAIGYWMSSAAIFYMGAATGLAAALAVLGIGDRDVDYNLAREAQVNAAGGIQVAPAGALLRDRRTARFLGAVLLFHLANAAMLPLVAERLAAGASRLAAPYMSACVIVAQLMMIPVALVAGRLAEQRGRKPLFLVGFAALPARGLLFALSSAPGFVVAVQILDGIGAGIFGVMSVIVAADLARNTGRFNLLLGVLNTGVAVGGSLSNLLGGYLAQQAGYKTGFLTLAAIAIVALVFFAIAVPETFIPAQSGSSVYGVRPEHEAAAVFGG